MPAHAKPPTVSRRPMLPSGRLLTAMIVLLIGLASGCSQLRLPAIDPTGSSLLAPFPTTTTLALPGSAGEGCGCLSCLHGIGQCLTEHFQGGGRPVAGPIFTIPEPAFPEPDPPPACPTGPVRPGGPAKAGCKDCLSHTCSPEEPCVPSSPCEGSCQHGPPPVLFGKEIGAKNRLHLPKRGQRGCILLTPQKIIAPVGGEVLLLSGVCGTDGYLQVGEPLEWMLTPDSVGTFIQVGDDAPGLLHRLAKLSRPEKRDASFARGVTSTKRMRITRGNVDPSDDVQLEKGQTWISISSPNEGTSRVTVLAPESECWDQRKATATIYWLDARWQFPEPQRAPAGTPVALTTRVTKAEGTTPAQGWRVRYEIQQPDLARFAGTDGSTVVEVEVNESGNATAELVPLEGASGNAVIDIQVIRPGGESDNMPTLSIARGQTHVTWSAPQLRLRAGAPEIATYDAPFDVAVDVANPGNQPVENVRVEAAIPPGATVIEADAFAQVLPNRVVWEIDVPIPPQQELPLTMQLSTRQPIQLQFEARAEGNLFAEDTVRVDVYRPSLAVSLAPERDRYESGETVRFDIEVQNIGDRPLAGVQLRAIGDSSMLHLESNEREAMNDKQDGPLQPGETWNTSVNYVPHDAGRRCLEVEATADGGQQAVAEACVTVIQPAPVTPAVSATLTAPRQRAVGDTLLIAGRVINSGRVPLRNVEVTMTFPPELRPVAATEPVDQSRLGEFILAWQIPELPPESDAVTLEGRFEALQATPRSQVIFTVRTAEGASDSEDVLIELLPDTPRSPQDTPSSTPSPAPDPSGPVAPPLPARSDQLEVSLLPLDQPARVGDPIRFSLSVTNDRDEIDGNVRVSFRLPEGLSVERAIPTTVPDAESFEREGDTIHLEDIRSMRAGETVNFRIVLRSNQAQSFDLTATAVSRLSPEGVSDTAGVDVVR